MGFVTNHTVQFCRNYEGGTIFVLHNKNLSRIHEHIHIQDELCGGQLACEWVLWEGKMEYKTQSMEVGTSEKILAG